VACSRVNFTFIYIYFLEASSCLRATIKDPAGHKWPAGHGLSTPGLDNRSSVPGKGRDLSCQHHSPYVYNVVSYISGMVAIRLHFSEGVVHGFVL
jgi:hypothetical protein